MVSHYGEIRSDAQSAVLLARWLPMSGMACLQQSSVPTNTDHF